MNESISAVQNLISESSPTANRYVLFLDIMGFKDRVARSDHKEILRDLQAISNFISDKISREEGLLFTMFSDSIIILSSDIQYKTFVAMVLLANAVVKQSVALKIPIKGALAKGKCTAYPGPKPLYFGQPIIDAYLLEESIELYNVALHHTVEEFAIRRSKESPNQIFDYEIKLKGGLSKHFVLGWFADNISECEDNLRTIRMTVSDSPRRYVDNTLKYISAFKEIGDNKQD